MKIIEPYIELEDKIDGQAILKKIERIGRVCYKSENNIKEDSAERFIKSIIARGHESVLEHVSISVRVICDRGVSHEIVRHRVASYSQESTRYCVAGDTKLTFNNSHHKMTIKELYENKQNSKNGSWKRMKIKQVNEDTGEIIYSPIKNIFKNGIKEVYEITTDLGYKLKLTGDHQIYTPKGYVKLNELKVGDFVYVNGENINQDELYKNYDWLYYQNITLNKTFVQISNEFGFNVSTLKRWARKLNIPKKGTGYFNVGRNPWNKGLSENDDARVKNQAEALRKYHHCGRRKDKILKEDTSKYQKHKKLYCEVCGIINDSLEVHHKNCSHNDNDPNNLITLCESCHQRIHHKNLLIIHEDYIVSIKKIGEEEVYDLEMNSKWHNFSANGVIVHNCNYSNEKFGNELTFIKPCYWDNEENTHEFEVSVGFRCRNSYEQWLKCMWNIEQCYFSMLDFGATPQEARSVLPNSLKTEIVMTMNLREWRHFFKLRCAKAAHPQMREVANMILEAFKKEIPIVFDDMER